MGLPTKAHAMFYLSSRGGCSPGGIARDAQDGERGATESGHGDDEVVVDILLVKL